MRGLFSVGAGRRAAESAVCTVLHPSRRYTDPMRLVQFVQVLLLLALAAYLLLVALENPAPVRLPLPLGRGELVVPAGLAVAAFAGLGGAYVLLLLLPPLWRSGARVRAARREREMLEARLTATLQARLGALPAASEPRPLLPGAPRPEVRGA